MRAVLKSVLPLAMAVMFIQALHLPGSASATSIGRVPPHNVEIGCLTLRELVENWNAKKIRDPSALIFPVVYSDRFGQVERDEVESFLDAMRTSEGKPDALPLKIDRVYQVHEDKVQPIYLVSLVRQVWHEKRIVEDALFNPVEVEAGYTPEWSYWLATFGSNNVRYFREVDELYPMINTLPEIPNCATGPMLMVVPSTR